MAFGCGLAGLVACILRWRLLRAGADEKGLLVAGQFPEIAGNILTALVFLVTALCLWKHRKIKITVRESAAVTAARVLAFILGAILFWKMSSLGKAAAMAAVLAAAVALAGVLGKHLPQVMEDIPALLFFMLSLLSCYRVWSAEPELQRYSYRLAALVSLMLATYHRSAISAGLAKGPLFLAASFLGIYFAFAASADPGYTVLFLALGLWATAQLEAATEETE